MKIIAVTMVRDEADIIARTLTHMLEQGVDEIVVADNLSTDGTGDILAELALEVPIRVRDDAEPGYYQDRKMTELAGVAAQLHGADWIVPFDADEFWCGRDGATLREAIEGASAEVLFAETYHHPPVGDEHMRTESPSLKSKVCFRWNPGIFVHMGNHDVNHEGERAEDGGIVIHEFQYRSFEQFARKVRNGKAAYEASNLPVTLGTHWRELGALDDERLRAEWELLTDPAGLVWDPWEPSGSTA